MKIVADAQIPYLERYFGKVTLISGREITPQDVKEADVLLVRSITRVNQALLEHSKVKFVGSVTAGADHLDVEWLHAAGIHWCVAHGFNAPPVADYVVSVVAALQRRQILSQNYAKVAVIGVGAVGRLVVERLKALGYSVVLCDPWRAENEPDFPHVPLEKIADVDMISLHVPLVHKGKYPTYHFIDAAFMERQEPGCVLLNASRGAVVNSEALLMHGEHMVACLDVWEHEPDISQALLDRVMIATPHIAGYSVQAKIRGVEKIYHEFAKWRGVEAEVESVPAPRQTLTFAGTRHHWQDVVMGIFNPILMTAMMRAMLLGVPNPGAIFDKMRDDVNYRYELAFTKVVCEELLEADRVVLHKLGITTEAEGLKA